MHCFLCLFHISWLDKVFSGCFRQTFLIWEKKKWSLVALDRWSSYTVTILWKFAWRTQDWLSYRGGCLDRFDCNALS